MMINIFCRNTTAVSGFVRLRPPEVVLEGCYVIEAVYLVSQKPVGHFRMHPSNATFFHRNSEDT